MLLLFEQPAGYGLFKLNDSLQISSVDADAHESLLKPINSDNVSKYFQLSKFQPLRDTAQALENATALVESKIPSQMKKLLKHVEPEETLVVGDKTLGKKINEKYGLNCIYSSEFMRVVREHCDTLVRESVSADENKGMTLGLAHSLSRYKLKFSPDKVDTMIVQAISLLDDLDKELNNMMMRLREWYGWHFPEMTKIVTDNLAYARTVKLMGFRVNAKTTELSQVLPEEVEAQVKESAELSMGCEISEEDLNTVYHLADRVIELSEYRAKLYEYLKSRMEAIAPNLTILLGEMVGARLVAHAGNLVNLAKHPASTIQVLGAEKALFRALKTKSDTPKYGLIYHASLVGQSAAKNKGKMARMLAAKAALAVRYDALGDADESSLEMGINNRAKLERRLKVLETGKVEKSPFKSEKKGKGGFSVKSETLVYDEAADSTMKDDSAKNEEPEAKKMKMEDDDSAVKEEATEESPKKKKKKKKSKTEEATTEEPAEAMEVEEEPAEKPKKKKKKKKSVAEEE